MASRRDVSQAEEREQTSWEGAVVETRPALDFDLTLALDMDLLA